MHFYRFIDRLYTYLFNQNLMFILYLIKLFLEYASIIFKKVFTLIPINYVNNYLQLCVTAFRYYSKVLN